eukprot:14727-Eustigmatos_ZCMA.PRE.1
MVVPVPVLVTYASHSHAYNDRADVLMTMFLCRHVLPSGLDERAAADGRPGAVVGAPLRPQRLLRTRLHQ